MQIIPAEKKHFSEINSLIEEEFSYTKKAMPKISLRLRQGSFIFVAEEKSVFFGFIEFKLKDFTACLLGMVTKKEFRGKNTGKKLIDFLIEFCRKNEIKKIFLIVKKENFNAKKLYSSKGFIKTRQLEKKIDGSVVERMELNLGEFSGVN